MDNGKIVEEGTFQSLMSDGREFSRLVEEFGAAEKEKEEAQKEEEEEGKKVDKKADEGVTEKKAKAALMQEEDRNRGAVPGSVYAAYLRYAGGLVWAPILILLLTLYQGASGTTLS